MSRIVVHVSRIVVHRLRLGLGVFCAILAWMTIPDYRPVDPPSAQGQPRHEDTVAIHFHCFHLEYVPRFLRAVENFRDADIFVSVVSELALNEFQRAWDASSLQNQLTLRIARNAGRNFGPLFVEFGAELRGYNLVVHVHSKNRNGRAFRRRWADFLWRWTIEDPAHVDKVRGLFSRDSTLGIYFALSPFSVPVDFGWFGSDSAAESLLPTYVRSEQGRPPFAYPAGGMLWFRPSALEPLFRVAANPELYEEEPLANPARKDGSTTEYAIERLVAVVPSHDGWKALTFLRPNGRFVIEDRFMSPLIWVYGFPFRKTRTSRLPI